MSELFFMFASRKFKKTSLASRDSKFALWLDNWCFGSWIKTFPNKKLKCPELLPVFICLSPSSGYNWMFSLADILDMSRIDLVRKKLLANCFRNFSNFNFRKWFTKKFCEAITYKYWNDSKNNKCNKTLDLERQTTKKGPKKSAHIAKIAKVTRIFLAT